MKSILIAIALMVSGLAYGQTAEEYFNRAFDKFELGDYRGAIADYSTAIELNPNYTDAYKNRGAAKAKLEDYKGAMADYNKVIELNPKQENVLPETETKIGQSFFGANASEIFSRMENPLTGGLQVSNQDFESYSKYIDRPFSINESDIDDSRAEGMSVLERLEENRFGSFRIVILAFPVFIAALYLYSRLLRWRIRNKSN